MTLFTGIRVRGQDRVIRNLQRRLKQTKNKTKEGLIAAGLKIRSTSQNLVPVDLANLKASAYTVWGRTGGETAAQFSGDDAANLSQQHVQHTQQGKSRVERDPNKIQVEVGYSAVYALFQHEDLEASHETGQAKFLELAFLDIAPQIIPIVQNKARIRG